MFENDIREVRQLLDDMRQRVKDTSDNGIAGQYNTYHYVANSQDTKAWAQGTAIGKQLVADLQRQEAQLKEFMNYTLKFASIVEDHVAKQGVINEGNY